VRREQDAINQIQALQEALSNIFTAPPDQQDAKVIKEVRKKLAAIEEAHAVILREIDTRFPKYSNLMDPKTVTVKGAQELLVPGEALISIFPGNTSTHIWAFAHQGPVQFASVSLNKRKLKKMVFNFRKALDSSPTTLGDIPEFDLGLAYDFYNKLLKPVESGWKQATDLLVIAPGPLGHLPFSLFLTETFSLNQEKRELFRNYQKAPWLIRKVSITRLPSVSSFVSLRTIPESDPDRKMFVGFGDPLFNKEQLAQTAKEETVVKFALASNKGRVNVRGVRLTQTANLDSETITTSHLGLLNRLPDTAEEIRGIAQATGANLEQDIFLGKRASEHRVKTMNLSDRRIVAFATHALVPGDLDGLDQPALALCAPSVSGDDEDGLLTMGEIMKLRMNADWVVLSACNTGAAGGAGAEAVSGLGRAFFYAGSRALLVSMWPVETTSARKLTTGLFSYQMENKKLSRAKALRKSMLDLIDGPGWKDPVSGKVIACYAHPLFWAPFIIVGDSGHELN
jgi:CHAT domain-containing protein